MDRNERSHQCPRIDRARAGPRRSVMLRQATDAPRGSTDPTAGKILIPKASRTASQTRLGEEGWNDLIVREGAQAQDPAPGRDPRRAFPCATNGVDAQCRTPRCTPLLAETGPEPRWPQRLAAPTV